MEKISRKIVGQNLKALREAVGLSQMKLAELTGISRASIVNIETQRTGYNIDLLEPLIQFFRIKLTDLTNKDYTISNNIRESLSKHYKNDSAIFVTISKKPSIVYAVNHKLLTGSFLDVPKEINEIKLFFEQLGWDFKGPSIQNTLKRMPKVITITDHPNKLNTKIYKKKN